MSVKTAANLPGEPSPDAPTNEQPSAPETTPSPSPTKECRYCNQTLRADAVTCRFCGRDQFSANASKLTLSPLEWNTRVPQWMMDEEDRLKRRWLFWKKVRKMQWQIVGVLLACGLTVIIWRLFTAPSDTYQPLQVSQRADRRTRRTAPATVETPVTISSPSATAAPSSEATPLSSAVVASPPAPAPATNSSESATVKTPPTTSEPKSDTVATVTPDSGSDDPAISLEAADLAGEYQDHRAFAEDKFNGRVVKVSGQIKQIDTSGNSAFILFMTGTRPPVKCFLKPSSKKELYRLKPGKLASLRGTCDGAFLEIIVSDCELIL